MWRLEFRGWFQPRTKKVVCYVPGHRLSDFCKACGVPRNKLWKDLVRAKRAADAVSSADPCREYGTGPFPILVPKRVK